MMMTIRGQQAVEIFALVLFWMLTFPGTVFMYVYIYIEREREIDR